MESTADNATDLLLLARSADGNVDALDELFDRHREPAYRVAYRLLGNEADALDALQDGFVKALNNLRKFERRCSFKTWLLRIVANASLDLGRNRKRRGRLIEVASTTLKTRNGTTPEHEDPAAIADEADLRSAVRRAMESLPEAQRQTFALHADGGLSYREIADAMETSIGTVMSRLFYARQKLKALLAHIVMQ
jgi:RNA polymerase sigma-70 factor, ECF subfamily